MDGMLPNDQVIVYTLPGCFGCKATLRDLKRRQIPCLAIDLSLDKNDGWKFHVEKELGFHTVPVVEILYDGKLLVSWCDYRPDSIKGLADLYSERAKGEGLGSNIGLFQQNSDNSVAEFYGALDAERKTL